MSYLKGIPCFLGANGRDGVHGVLAGELRPPHTLDDQMIVLKAVALLMRPQLQG